MKFSHRQAFERAKRLVTVFDESLSRFHRYGDIARFLADSYYSKRTLERYFDECFPYIPNMYTQKAETGRTLKQRGTR